MPVYKRRISTRDARFKDKHITIMTAETIDDIEVPDNVVICNGCNANIYSEEKETFGWLIYFDKRDVKADRPYDIYCNECVKRSFPDAIEVS